MTRPRSRPPRFTPSADGKTLTDVSAAPTTTEKVAAVYDRQ